MRRLLLATLPALFALVLALPAYAQTLSHFTSSTTGLAFDYPSDWQVREGTGPIPDGLDDLRVLVDASGASRLTVETGSLPSGDLADLQASTKADPTASSVTDVMRGPNGRSAFTALWTVDGMTIQTVFLAKGGTRFFSVSWPTENENSVVRAMTLVVGSVDAPATPSQ
jgi:hypothetical protein